MNAGNARPSFIFWQSIGEKINRRSGSRTAQMIAVRRNVELQPVFAGSFHVIVAYTSAASAERVMSTVMAMPAADDVSARLQVGHWNFARFRSNSDEHSAIKAWSTNR